MPKLKEILIPDQSDYKRKDGAPVMRAVLMNESKDYSKAPGTREIERRRRQNAHTKATAG